MLNINFLYHFPTQKTVYSVNHPGYPERYMSLPQTSTNAQKGLSP